MLKRIYLCFLLLFVNFNLFGQNFTTIWNTSNIEDDSSLDNQITIPTNPAYTYNYTVDWGDTMSNTGVTGNITHTYTTPGNYTITISGTFPSIYFNNEEANDKLKIIEILDWGTIEWQTMENAFYGCENLNFDAIDSPDLSDVTSLQNMFNTCTSFNGIVNNWDLSGITNISGIFANAIIFNRPLDNWTTNAITDMSFVFKGAQLFNEPLDNWNTSSVETMESMFDSAANFNQNINNWTVTSVTNMSRTFLLTSSFDKPLNNWRVDNVTDMSSMFGNSNFNQPINNWIVNEVTDMSGMFQRSKFNQPLDNWNVAAVTNMSSMFSQNRNFNQPINSWNVANVTNMSNMFRGVFSSFTPFNQPLDLWEVGAVTNMSGMFQSSDFNRPINNWDVSAVENMNKMFAGFFNAPSFFDQPLDAWVTTSVTNMSGMFSFSVFNQPIENWDVSNVTNMSTMFEGAENFNLPLTNWMLNSLNRVNGMFKDTLLFNQDLSNWNITNITDMSSMFNGALAFDKNLASWDITNITDMELMLSNSGLSQENYDNTLIGWAAQEVSDNVDLGATSLQYCDGRLERQDLIDNHGWNITGDAINCTNVFCTTITSPLDTDTNVPANSSIRWEPAPNATGYRITLEIERGGLRDFVLFDGDIANNLDVGNVVGLDFTNEFNADDTVFITVVPYNDEGPAEDCEETSFTVVASWVNSPAAYKIQIDTRIDAFATTPMNQMEIEINNDFSYDYSIDWGDGQYNNNVSNDIVHTYLVPGIYTIAIIGDFPAPYFGTFGDGEKVLSIDQWGTHEYLSMERACGNCENMIYNAVDIPNLSQVTNMNEMFNGASKFDGNINNWNVSNVETMLGTFIGAIVFNQPLNNWNVSNVTNMESMFVAARKFNQDINNWNVENVTNMARMFERASEFDKPLNNWNVDNVTQMQSMFRETSMFNQPLNNWNVDNVTNMAKMFSIATVFNQNLNSWNVDNVTNMQGMFQRCNDFDFPLNNWNVDNVTNMAEMFNGAIAFNQPLNNWKVGSVNTMEFMFSAATNFNQDIDSWNVTNVTTMRSMFSSTDAFQQDLNSWNVNSVVDMSSMFKSAEAFNNLIENWDVSAVANMTSMFEGAIAFNQPINSWDVSSVTLMPSMFKDAEAFAQELNNWNVSVVTDFNSMFKNATVFDNPLNMWDTGEALNMEDMFNGATTFNKNLNNWNVSFVTTMQGMFNDATNYNQPMNTWNVASVTTMEDMFKGATAFNENIDDWNVRAVTSMEEMFSGATMFNRNLNNWRVSRVTQMDFMFREASAYNQPMDLWNLGNVSMRSTFFNAIALNQDLGDWDISGVSDMRDMLDNTALTRENYDNTIIAWSEQTPMSGITLGAEDLPYCDAQEERQSMIDNFGWTFDRDVRDCPIPLCTQLASPLNGDVDVPVNTNITWDAALFAQGYRLTVGTSPGANDIVDNATIINETSYEFTSDFDTEDIVYVTIIPFNDEGDAVGPCIEESFTISNIPATIPECTALITPMNGAMDVKVGTDISWSSISNADGYKLNVGTTAGGTDILNAEDVGNVITYEFTTDLPEDKDIFVTIIPYNDEGEPTTCIEEKFTTELIPVPPICTALTTPLNNATDIAIDTQLSWNSIPNAIGYLVTVGTTSGGIEVANNIDVVGVTMYTFPVELEEDRLYYVKITPYNNEGDAMNCSEETFRTGNSNSPPSCTNLTIPMANAIAVAPNTNITWAEVTSATGYNLSIGTTSGGSEIFSGDVGNVLTYDPINNLAESTTVYVKITPYNDNGPAIDCTEESFITDGPPSCTTLMSPANEAINIANNLGQIVWNESSNAEGYKLTVMASNSTANNITNFEITTGTSYDFSNLFQAGETVTVSIIPYNNTGDASNCISESFTIKSVPACTNLSLPLNNAIDISVNTNIEWTPITEANEYKITVVASNSTLNNVTDLLISNGTSYNFPNNFEQGETVTVTITPVNEVGDAVGCTSESFTIKSVPSCTNLTAPMNGDTVPQANQLTWTNLANADSYKVTISGSITTINNETDLVVNGNTHNFANDFVPGEVITVTITPFNEVGDAIGCTSESFTVRSIPDCTTLISPLNNTIDVSTMSDISWNADLHADGYRISVGTTPNGIDIVDNEDVLSLTTYTFSENLPSETLIYVSIIPYNTSGEATTCSSESFMTELVAPECSVLITPFNGEEDVALENNITWGEVDNIDGYRLSLGTSAGGTDILNNQDMGINNSYTPSQDYPFGTQIYVTITPYNIKGDAEQCSEFSFTTLIPEDETKYGFSPDGDGINEYWHIDNIQYYPENIVTIYNRWGDAVFEIKNYDNNFAAFRGDANLKTKIGAGRLPEGTYFFNIQINGKNILNKTKGYLVLKR